MVSETGIPTDSDAKLRALLAAVEGLAPEQRRLIRWIHADGLSHEEVATRLGVSEREVRAAVARAMARLARLLRDPGESEE